ncbi:unnamed protein product [Urochloa humidicola]
MGWADLWRGVLLCDVLDPKPSLRGVPVPLPLVEMGYNNEWGWSWATRRSAAASPSSNPRDVQILFTWRSARNVIRRLM